MVEFIEYLEKAIVEEDESIGAQVTALIVLGPPMWKLYVDGVANQKGSDIRIVLISLERVTIEKSLRLGFSTTNNEAKYEALFTGVPMVKKLRGKAMEIFSDSRLVVR